MSGKAYSILTSTNPSLLTQLHRARLNAEFSFFITVKTIKSFIIYHLSFSTEDPAMFNVQPAAKFLNHLLMATKYQARIYVTLRSSVLDPAGTAVESGLKQMGYTEVESVRIGKYIEMQLTAADEEQALQHLDEMCDRLLANVVIENYRFELTELATA